MSDVTNGRRWHWLWIWECSLSRWGLGAELSFGHWWPMEWSAYVFIGPFMFGGGVEENLDWRYGPSDDGTAAGRSVEAQPVSQDTRPTTEPFDSGQPEPTPPFAQSPETAVSPTDEGTPHEGM